MEFLKSNIILMQGVIKKRYNQLRGNVFDKL